MEQVEKPTRWSLNDLLPEPVEQALEERGPLVQPFRRPTCLSCNDIRII